MSNSIQVETFFRSTEAFIPVHEYSRKLKDPRYVEGAIVLQIGDTKVLDFELWDLVDQLWGSLVEGMKAVSDGRAFETHFPDQPVKLKLSVDPRKTKIEIDVRADNLRSASTNYKRFMAALLPAGESFFRRMLQINPSHAAVYQAYLADIAVLRAKEGL